jgi:hypothetical protein
MFGRKMLGDILRHKGGDPVVAPPVDEMCGVGAADQRAGVTGLGAGAAALSGWAKTAPVTSPDEALSTSRLEYLRCRMRLPLEVTLVSHQPVAATHTRPLLRYTELFWSGSLSDDCCKESSRPSQLVRAFVFVMDNLSAKPDPVNGRIRCVRNPIVPDRGVRA